MAISRKYGRTYHYPFSPGTTSDDRIQHNYWQHISRIPTLVHTEKLDGENNCLSRLGVFARSHAAPTISPWTESIRQYWQQVRHDLGDMEVFVENLYAIHSIEYRALDHHFYVFGIREHNHWLSWEETKFYAAMLDLPTVPEIQVFPTPACRPAFESEVLNIVTGHGSLNPYDTISGQPATMEGIVTRNAGRYPVDAFTENVFKYVRKGHVKTDEHWTRHWKRARLKTKEDNMWTITKDKNWASLEAQFDWVADMHAVPQDARHHAEGNVAVHTQMVLQALQEQPDYQALSPQDQEVLWAAALLHDVEKRSTTATEPDGSITAHGHARKGAMTARRVLYMDIPTPFALREQIVALVRYHGLPLWLLEKPNPVKELVKASLELDTRQLALLARADALGRICTDQADLLYRIDCFEAYCREQGCWGQPRPFTSAHARVHYLQQEQGYPDYIPFDQPVCELILMCGLPGAGKDSYIKKHLPGMPVISLDDIRVEMDIDPTDKTGNGHVIQAAKEQARVFLRSKTPFVWNATNTTRSMRTQLVELFTTYKAAVKIVYVEAPYRVLHGQNRNREAIVPPAVLERLAWKLEPPAMWEAHEVVYLT